MSAGHVWKLNLVKETERNWENIYKTYCKWDAVWIFLTHFGDQQCAHSSAGAATERMAKLEALQTSLVELLNQKERPLSLHLHSTVQNTGEEIKLETTVWICLAKWQLQLYYSRQASVASLCFFSDNIKYWVNQLSTFGVVTLTGFSTTNSVFHCLHFGYLPKMLFTKNHTKVKATKPTQPCLRPIVARTCRCFDNSNTEIQSFGNSTSEGLCQSGNESDGQTDCMIRNAKKFPIETLCKATSRHQPVCPKTKLSGRNNWPNGPARTLSIVPAKESNKTCFQQARSWFPTAWNYFSGTCVWENPHVLFGL